MQEKKPPTPEAKPLEFKLLGHDYVTPDLVAKVTGKARYAEDFRADGMLFIKLMPSPRLVHLQGVDCAHFSSRTMPGDLLVPESTAA